VRPWTMPIDRWPSSAKGRSRVVAFGSLVWLVGNGTAEDPSFASQVRATFAALDAGLRDGGSTRSRLLSVHVLFADLGRAAEFEPLWLAWIGNDPSGWPQRACYQARLATALQIEIVAVAARDSPG
jgi:enamine deaminase RidA (YjgF/YER057c/UK114 family)